MAEEPRRSGASTSLVPIAAALGSLVISAVTMAPLGLMLLLGKHPPLKTAHYVSYWSLLIVLVGIALIPGRRRLVRWIVLTLATISLLNLGGCIAVLGELARATNG